MLRIASGMNAGERFDLKGREFTIGRDPMCDVTLKSKTVSRQHARIVHESGSYFIEDLRSINGTSINGRRVDRRTPLNDHDQIGIFDTVLTFYVDRPDDNTPVTARRLPPPPAPDESHHRLKVTDLDFRASADDSSSSAAKTLDAVLQIARTIGSSFELDKILPNVLDTLFAVFPQAQRGYVLQSEKAGGELVLTAIKHAPDESDTLSPISNVIAQRVMRDGTAFLSKDTFSDQRLQEAAESIFEQEVRSLMCAPLMGPSMTATGVIHVESSDAQQPFHPDDLEVLVSVAFLAGQAIEFSRLHEQLLELDLRRREGDLARRVQLQFLPADYPSIPGYDFYHHYQAADYVAGDYYDYVELPDGRLALVQADVSGKGASAALLVARLCSDVRYSLFATESPTDAVSHLNRAVSREIKHSGSFVTLVLCVLDPRSHRLTIVNAGHPRPILRRGASGEVEELTADVPNLPLGVKPAHPFSTQALELAPGDLLLCYTDGVSEALNPENKLYGVPAVHRAVKQSNPTPLHTGRALLSDLQTFRDGRLQADDICIVSFSRVNENP